MRGHGRGRVHNGKGPRQLISLTGRLGAALAAVLIVILGAAVPASAQTATSTGVVSSGSPSTVGQSVTFTATVTPTPDGGTVDFTGGGITTCLGVTLTSGVATCTTSALAAGAGQAITATYSGDTNFDTSFGTTSQTVLTTTSTGVVSSSPSSTVGQSVTFTATVTPAPDGGTVAFTGGGITTCAAQALTSGVATCTTSALSAGANQTITAVYSGNGTYATSTGTTSQTVNSLTTTSTGIVSSGSPSTVGQSVTFTATVTPAPDGGTVAFTGGGITTCAAQALTSGVATCTTSALSAGANQTITAVYSGNGTYATSTGTTSQTVNSLTTTSTGIGSSGSPSTVGQSVTFTATVTPAPNGGTVAFTGGGITTCAAQALTSGVATCTTSALSAGANQTITAVYSGNGTYATSTGTTSQTVNTPLTTTSIVASSSNPSTLGGSVTFTATVTPTPNAGTVAFSDNGSTLSGCGAQPLTSGVASCAVTYSSAGSHSVVAVYSGATGFTTSTSPPLNQVVLATPTSVTLTSSANPSTFGQSVSLLATVNTAGGHTPTGNVEFFDGTTLLGTFALGGSGLSTSALAPNQAELSTSALSQGTHSITAVYSGDSLDQPNSSSPLAQVVNAPAPKLPATTTTLSSGANPSVVGHPTTLTATVVTTSPGGSVTGSVQFFDGNISLGTVPLVGNQAVVEIEAKLAGTYVLTASYSGDAANGPSTSGALNQVALGLGQAGTHGYWLVGSDGGIFSFGDAYFYGSTGALTLQRPVVGITPTSDLEGYWLVASDGGVFTFGDAGFYGSIPGLGFSPAGSGAAKKLNAPIVGMVPSSDGGGYFMVGSDGGVFAFGDAKFEGSCPGIGGCSGAAVTVMPDATGNGYWLVTASGHIYTFGDAAYYGAPGPQNVPVTSAVRTPDGKGYWILFSNGAVAGYGDAGHFGSPTGVFGGLNPASAILATVDGQGYWVASANGSVYTYGDAPFAGSMAGTKLNGPIIAATGF